jgi:hypothetical protein
VASFGFFSDIDSRSVKTLVGEWGSGPPALHGGTQKYLRRKAELHQAFNHASAEVSDPVLALALTRQVTEPSFGPDRGFPRRTALEATAVRRRRASVHSG